jgi:hypothetical protein
VKARRKEPQERLSRRWVDGILTAVGELAWAGVDWLDLAQISDKWRAPLNAAMNF